MTETMSDQTEVESQEEENSDDEDSTMEDVGFVAETPQTMDLAPSDSQNASEASTRASNPTDNRAECVSADSDSLKIFEHDDVADDITMKDVGPRKNGPASAAD